MGYLEVNIVINVIINHKMLLSTISFKRKSKTCKQIHKQEQKWRKIGLKLRNKSVTIAATGTESTVIVPTA